MAYLLEFHSSYTASCPRSHNVEGPEFNLQRVLLSCSRRLGLPNQQPTITGAVQSLTMTRGAFEWQIERVTSLARPRG